MPRRHSTETTKRHPRLVLVALGGRCPCCGVARVLDDGGRVVAADFDHYCSRERRDFTETWLICRPCHRRASHRAKFAASFEAYHQRAEQVEAGRWGYLVGPQFAKL